MHELALTREIVAIVCQAAAGRRVHTVTLEVGEWSCAAPEALEFCFQAVAQGTCAANARLDIRRTGGDDLMVTRMEIEEAA
ncbi:MAG TPA: hydrogenase maturation nickel metallochaperone HypA [Acetobacteraceae bacterium]|jgi:hydrogenase nickel incorporation protein HypA/HybF